MRRKRRFSNDFKRELIDKIEAGGLTVMGQAAIQHQFSQSLIYRWRGQIDEGTLKDHPSAREKQLERELERYKRKVATSRPNRSFKKTSEQLTVHEKVLWVRGYAEICGSVQVYPNLTGFVFLAMLLDIFSRRVVGWAISKRINHELTLEALKTALITRKPGKGLIHHSDHGVQYACHA